MLKRSVNIGDYWSRATRAVDGAQIWWSALNDSTGGLPRLALAGLLAVGSGIWTWLRESWLPLGVIVAVMGYFAFRRMLGSRAALDGPDKPTSVAESAPERNAAAASAESASPSPPLKNGLPGTSSFPAGFYVGDIRADAQRLAGKRQIDISIAGFNATGETISVSRVAGHVLYRKAIGGSLGDRVQLVHLQIVSDTGRSSEVANLAELSVVLRVTFSAEIAAEAEAVIARGDLVHLRFGELKILVHVANDPKRIAQLPLWDGVTIGKNHTSIATGRIRGLAAEPEMFSLAPVGSTSPP